MKVILLGGGDINKKFRFEKFIYKTPLLLPVGSDVLVNIQIDSIKNNLRLREEDIFVALNKRDLSCVKLFLKYKNINLISLPPTKNVNESLTLTIKIISDKIKNNELILICVCTTYINFIPLKENEVFLDKKRYSEPVNLPFSFIDPYERKFYFKNYKHKQGYAFSGAFSTTIEYLKKVLTTKSDDLLYLIFNLDKIFKLDFNFIDWVDFGHQVNFSKSKRVLLKSRFFNTFKFEDDNNIINKISFDQKLEDESYYYDMIPLEFKSYFPTKYSFAKIKNKRILSLEYIGYKVLSELYLFYKLSEDDWFLFFDKLDLIFTNFKRYKFSIGKEWYIKFYFGKLIERYNVFIKQIRKEYNWIVSNEKITINGTEFVNLNYIKDEIYSQINKVYNEDDFAIVHGDLCFNNILYNIENSIIKLIDPRGSFVGRTIYGDIKYDFAKLMHSIYGLYDAIIYGLYDINIDNKKHSVEYKIHIPNKDNYLIANKYMNNLLKKHSYEIKKIKFLMSLLFLSMPPLHKEDINRQILFYVHGLKYINQTIGEL